MATKENFLLTNDDNNGNLSSEEKSENVLDSYTLFDNQISSSSKVKWSSEVDLSETPKIRLSRKTANRNNSRTLSKGHNLRGVRDTFDDFFGDTLKPNAAKEKQRRKVSVSHRKTQNGGGPLIGDEAFVADDLPNFAKSYILPKVMRKDSVEARLKKNEKVAKSDDEVEKILIPEDKAFEAFKFSMLKASLDYESGFVGTTPFPPKSKPQRKKLSTGSSKVQSANTSGRTSSMSLHSNPSVFRSSRKISSGGGAVNCTGPGDIAQYVKYVKSGGFVPLPILEPERGVEASLFALNPGLDALDGFDADIVFTSNNKLKFNKSNPTSMVEAHSCIDQQFEEIRDKFGEPTIVIKTEEEEERDRQDMLEKLRQKSSTSMSEKKTKGDNLLDNEIPSSFESGYSTWLETSSEDTPNEDQTMKNVLNSIQKESLLGGENSLLQFADSADKRKTKIIQDAMMGNNLLGMMEEPKDKFNRPGGASAGGDMSGSDSMDLFIDPISIFGSDRHPALVAVLQQLDKSKRHRAEKIRLQEELFKLKSFRKDHELRKQHLLNKAKVLQNRATKFKAKMEKEIEELADIWDQKYLQELEKTGPLDHVCAALREDLDHQHKKRMEALETKMKPIMISDGPSKKANYKITASRLHCEIYALTQRLRLTTIRAEHESARREKREREVCHLRHLISEKKTTIGTVTKGVPFSKLEVRPYDQLPYFSGPTDADNPLLRGMPNAKVMAAARINSSSPLLRTLPTTPGLPSKITAGLFPNPVLPRIGFPPQGVSASFVPPTATDGSCSSDSSSIPSSANQNRSDMPAEKNNFSMEAIETS